MTPEALEFYRLAWQGGLEPKALSLIKICHAFYEMEDGQIVVRPRSFSELVELAGVSSRTLNKWLKNAEKKGFIKKEKQKAFPPKTQFVLNVSYEVQTFMKTLYAYDRWFESQIEGVVKGYANAAQTLEKVLKYYNDFGLWLKVDDSWLTEAGELIRIFFSALSLIMFWGTFCIIHALPREEVEKTLRERGLLQPTERELFERVFASRG